jgi:hypothetical protein
MSRRVMTLSGITAAALLLSACATTPPGPTVAVMPGHGKTFADFQQDQWFCKDFAHGEVAGSEQHANNMQVGTALIGTLLGAGLGAAIGGGQGAAIGAGAGALGGTVVGAGPAAHAQFSMQDRYDLAYSQCMYAHGNIVPEFHPTAYRY